MLAASAHALLVVAGAAWTHEPINLEACAAARAATVPASSAQEACAHGPITRVRARLGASIHALELTAADGSTRTLGEDGGGAWRELALEPGEWIVSLAQTQMHSCCPCCGDVERVIYQGEERLWGLLGEHIALTTSRNRTFDIAPERYGRYGSRYRQPTDSFAARAGYGIVGFLLDNGASGHVCAIVEAPRGCTPDTPAPAATPGAGPDSDAASGKGGEVGGGAATGGTGASSSTADASAPAARPAPPPAAPVPPRASANPQQPARPAPANGRLAHLGGADASSFRAEAWSVLAVALSCANMLALAALACFVCCRRRGHHAAADGVGAPPVALAGAAGGSKPYIRLSTTEQPQGAATARARADSSDRQQATTTELATWSDAERDASAA